MCRVSAGRGLRLPGVLSEEGCCAESQSALISVLACFTPFLVSETLYPRLTLNFESSSLCLWSAGIVGVCRSAWPLMPFLECTALEFMLKFIVHS